MISTPYSLVRYVLIENKNSWLNEVGFIKGVLANLANYRPQNALE